MYTNQAPSDSEEDADYVPPAEEEDSSSDSEHETNNLEDKQLGGDGEESKDLKKIWESFEASIQSTSSISVEPGPEVRKVKIIKKYRFAGEEQEEVVKVPADSEDAKRWPHQGEPPIAGTSKPVAEEHPHPPLPVRSKPGPRKPKTTLASLPGPSKVKKITTLQKSAMDWKAHVDAQKETGVHDELEANRRGGGYLEKVEFLKRVEERKEENLEAARSTKRRKL